MKRVPLVFLLLLAACAGSVPVGSDYNPTVDFSTYHSFSFDPASIQAGEDTVGRDPRVLDTIVETIREDLGARPMTAVESGGDLSVSISIAVGEATEVDQWGVTWNSGEIGTGNEAFQFESGTLLIDFFDNANGQLVWRGWVQSAVRQTDDPDLEGLERAVQAVLAQYPPAAGKG